VLELVNLLLEWGTDSDAELTLSFKLEKEGEEISFGSQLLLGAHNSEGRIQALLLSSGGRYKKETE